QATEARTNPVPEPAAQPFTNTVSITATSATTAGLRPTTTNLTPAASNSFLTFLTPLNPSQGSNRPSWHIPASTFPASSLANLDPPEQEAIRQQRDFFQQIHQQLVSILSRTSAAPNSEDQPSAPGTSNNA